jgi:hypothetical protein
MWGMDPTDKLSLGELVVLWLSPGFFAALGWGAFRHDGWLAWLGLGAGLLVGRVLSDGVIVAVKRPRVSGSPR